MTNETLEIQDEITNTFRLDLLVRVTKDEIQRLGVKRAGFISQIDNSLLYASAIEDLIITDAKLKVAMELESIIANLRKDNSDDEVVVKLVETYERVILRNSYINSTSVAHVECETRLRNEYIETYKLLQNYGLKTFGDN